MMLCKSFKRRASRPHCLSRGRPAGAMDYDTVPKAAIVFSVVAVIIAAAAVAMVATDGADDRYRIYVGMDGDATQSQMDALESYMKDTITSDYGTGYTMYWADGAYTDNGDTIQNRTLVVILLDVSSGDAGAIADAALDQDGVSSVVKEVYRSSFDISTN